MYFEHIHKSEACIDQKKQIMHGQRQIALLKTMIIYFYEITIMIQ